MSVSDKNKTSDEFMSGNRPMHRKRILIFGGLVLALFVVLVLKTAWIQIIKGEEYSRAALEQQTSDNTVSAKRGKILTVTTRFLQAMCRLKQSA